MTHIPTVRRAVLHPIHEALPPQPTFTERLIGHIPVVNMLQGDIIGFGAARLDHGGMDWNNTNLYWRIMYLIDRLFGSDICGFKADREEADL